MFYMAENKVGFNNKQLYKQQIKICTIESVGPNGLGAVVLWSRGERSQNLCSLKIGSRTLLDQPLPLTCQKYSGVNCCF